ncbi:MerR family transcriptional regulator [Salipaludibacillus sp. HK11]|uniref:MerR family transcriptional regulator n=1 Tax=Salipaludibacillus sp. HK11 TaxID=3394320 RepID=UPI0039FC94E3
MINKSWKTKEVAEEFGVNPSTVQRWIKHFQLSCEINSQGHFELNEATYKKLKHIHNETNQGKKLKEVTLAGHRFSTPQVQFKKMVPTHRLDERIDRLIIQVDQLDRNLQTKADEVVEYQVLNQRKEINELNDLISQLTRRLQALEAELREKEQRTFIERREVPMKKRRLAGIFSL